MRILILFLFLFVVFELEVSVGRLQRRGGKRGEGVEGRERGMAGVKKVKVFGDFPH